MTPTATLAELAAELDATPHVGEADLIHPYEIVDGFMDGTRVYVNPKPAVVETLLHELIHRRYPRWSERRVDREAKGLVLRMTTRQINAWYRRFQTRAKRHKTPKRIDV